MWIKLIALFLLLFVCLGLLFGNHYFIDDVNLEKWALVVGSFWNCRNFYTDM